MLKVSKFKTRCEVTPAFRPLLPRAKLLFCIAVAQCSPAFLLFDLMERTRRSSSATGDASRKRKRGALQDISNNAKKLSRRKATDAAKPPTKSTRRKTTATSVNSALKSSMASTAASKAKKRVKAAEASSKTKRRKPEGAENQPPHQKIQTSMLSFQAAPTIKKEKKDEDKENVEVNVKVRWKAGCRDMA
jgi:hypothetical protein